MKDSNKRDGKRLDKSQRKQHKNLRKMRRERSHKQGYNGG